ncbi:MAG: PAS domain S-box protein [Anaerolineae bacterium]
MKNRNSRVHDDAQLRGQANEPTNDAAANVEESSAGAAAEASNKGDPLFRQLFDNMNTGVAIYQPVDGGADFSFSDINAAGLRITGLERSQVMGRTLTELFPGVGEMGLLDALRRVWDTGQAEDLPAGKYSDDRLSKWYANRLFKIPSGEVVALYDDLTLSKQTESAVAAERQLLRTVIDNLPFSVYAKDLQGRKTLANRADVERMGLSTEEEALGKTDYDIYPPDRAAEYAANDQRVLLGGVAILNEERLHVTPEGRREWRLGSRVPLTDGEGQIIGLVGISQDITERKQADEALQESEARFRTLFEAAPEGIFVHSNGRLTFVNPAICSMMGASSPEELLGTHYLDLIPPEYREEVAERTRVGQETGAPAPTMELELLRKDGSRIPIESTPVPVRYQGSPSQLVLVRDITGRKRREKERAQLDARLAQLQRLESTGQLAGGVAHDFNNMLGVILGYADMALGRVDATQPIFAELQEIRKAAQRSADLTQQLLGFAGKQTAAPISLDVNMVVEDMLSMLRRLVGEDITVTWVPAPVPCTIKFDPAQLNQVLVNLCINAREAIDGVGELIIETGHAALDQEYCSLHAEGCDPGEYVVVAVSDNGRGMDEETQQHLFEPFYTTKRTGEGAGLGLATVHGIVLQNRGSISVYSEPGQGTTFRIYLPLEPLEPGIKRPPAPVAPASRGYETVLLVDDEQAVLTMTAAMLARQGYTVLPASSPAYALRLAEEHTGEIGLLLTDVVMPGMNGRDLAREILSIHPTIRCLFMSGYSSEVIEHRGMLGAGVNFIAKPFTLHELAIRVRQVLDGDVSKV